MDQKRSAARKRILKSGTIEFNGGAIDCIVRNISETGAALDVTSPIGIPDSFRLIISSEDQRKLCHIVWRKESRIGVRFS
jgi:hypothetical protein